MNKSLTSTTALVASQLVLNVCGGRTECSEADSEENFEVSVLSVFPDKTDDAVNVRDWFMEEVNTRVDGRIFFDKLLVKATCNATKIIGCVQDSRANMGLRIPDYTPELFLATEVVGIPLFLWLPSIAAAE